VTSDKARWCQVDATLLIQFHIDAASCLFSIDAGGSSFLHVNMNG